MAESAFTGQIEQTTTSKLDASPLLGGIRTRIEASVLAGLRISSEFATTVFGVKNERCSVTPEVAGSSPVAPVSHSESDCASSRAFARRANGGARHREPSKVSSRQKNGDQNGDHGRGAMAGDRP